MLLHASVCSQFSSTDLAYLTYDDSSQSPSVRSVCSTETAVLSVLSDILLAVDRADFAASVLLDLSAAFDTVDHDILLKRLQTSFGIDGVGFSPT